MTKPSIVAKKNSNEFINDIYTCNIKRLLEVMVEYECTLHC